MPFLPLSFFGNKVKRGALEVAEKGSVNIDTTVAAGATYVKEITLGKATYEMGICELYIPTSATSWQARRRGSSFVFGTTTNEAIAMSSDTETIGIGCGCTIKVPEMDFFMYEDDATLSGRYFAADGRGQLYFRKAYIDGDKFKLEFENTHGYTAAALLIGGRYIVIK